MSEFARKSKCVDVADIRQIFYDVNNLYDLYTNVAEIN